MASTFLDEKISSFIEDKFPEFVKADHPVFVDFLRLYYQFMEASKITLTNVLGSDQILLENKLTTNYLANEFDDTRFVYEDSTYGAFIKDETVTGQTSGAVSTILSENNSEGYLYIETNRHFQVGEIITGGTSAARATISKYQGNPVQNIQQLLEYVNVDKTISDFLDQFRNTYLTSIPNTLATGVSKRKLIKSVRDLYRAKGTRKGHEAFFRLMFDETPELTYPTENILKISAGDWSSDTVLRVVATENNPNNLVGQTVTQTVNVGLDHGVASANVETILQLQEGETTVYQLILNVASIEGTFISGAEVTGIDNTDADISISATVQPVLIGAAVTEGAAGYTTDDIVTISSATGQNALISIVDVGSGELGQIVIDNPGSNYSVGDPLFFDNTNTEGAGASAIVSCIGGAIAPEAGDIAAYGMETFDHIIYDEGTEATDAYTGSQIELETATFADLSVTGEAGEVVNVTVFNPGSGYELMPTITPATSKLTYNSGALTTSGTFSTGETISNDASPAVTATIVTSIRGSFTISKASGAFAAGQVITGNNSNAQATLTVVTALGANATFLGWSQSGIGSITGVEVSNFGTGFSTAPSASVPVKMLLTRKIISDVLQADITLATAFSVGDTIIGQTSNARGVVTAWDNTRQTLTVKTTLGTFQRAETLTRGAGVNYAVVSEIAQGVLSTTVGTVGTTAGAFNNDKGKISESLMKIQDSYYYQDFSYVVKVGAAIKDWRAEIKKSVHPAGFAMFGEVSITNKVATLMTTPITGVTTETPTLASLFEAVITTVIGRRLGTLSDGTTLLGSTEIKGTTDHVAGTLKRGSHLGHEPQLFSTVESITRSGTTATVETTGPHGAEAGEQVEISGVTTTGYDGVYEVLTKTDDKFTITVSGSLSTPATVGIGKVKLVSPFDNSTRDVTARPHTEVTVYPLYGEWNSNQKSRYGLGPRQSNAAKYMWATSPTEYAGSSATDTIENHQTLLESSTATNDDFLILEPEVLSDVDFTVTVTGGNFVIDGTSQKALEFDGARFYRFDVSDSSVSGHPFTFSDETSEGGEYDEQSPDLIEFQIELESGSYTEYSLHTNTRWNLIAEDGDNLAVTSNSRVTRYGTAGTAGAHIYLFTENLLKDMYYYCSNHSGMGSTISLTPRTGGNIINEAFQLGGEVAITNIILEDGGYIIYETDTDSEDQSVMVSEESTITYSSVTEDVPTRIENPYYSYVYPNITRRESPETGTDNVDAGSAGVYDTTMNYTNIQIGTHESHVHHRISDFANVRIVDIIKSGREVLEAHDDTSGSVVYSADRDSDAEYEFTIMEDGSYVQMESGAAGLPAIASKKIWNVPPPSYIRLTTS